MEALRTKGKRSIQDKIVFITKEIKGGNFTFIDQIRKLNSSKFSILFCFLKQDENMRFSKYHQQPYYYINSSYPSDEFLSPRKVLLFLVILLRVFFFLNREKPKVIFVYDLYSFIMLSILKTFFFKKSLFVYFLNNDVTQVIKNKPVRIYRMLLNWYFEKALPHTDLLITPSRGLKRYIKVQFQISSKKLKVIYHGIDLLPLLLKKNHFNMKVNNNCFRIFSAGRFSKQKDFCTILNAVHLLLQKGINIRLFLIGDGELRKRIQAESQRLGIKDKIRMLGWKNDIRSHLKSADLFVFSSFYEGFGLTLLEAMASKIPVIATNTPFGPSEILDHGKYGILVPVGNYKILAERIERLIKNSKLRSRMATKAYERAGFFSLEKMIREYEKTFLKLLSSNEKTL